MNATPPPPRRKPSLEELIRLKGWERPSAEFWSDFEDELRRRQLAASMRSVPRWAAWWEAVRPRRRRYVLVPALAGAACAVLLLFQGARIGTVAPSRPTVTAEVAAVVTAQPPLAEPVVDLVRREPVVAARFVLDELARPASQHAFRTVAAPATLRTETPAVQQYAVYTLMSGSSRVPF